MIIKNITDNNFLFLVFTTLVTIKHITVLRTQNFSTMQGEKHSKLI